MIAGAALVGVSGLAFLGELNAIPNVDGVADSVKGFQGFMEGVVSRFQVKLFNFTRVSKYLKMMGDRVIFMTLMVASFVKQKEKICFVREVSACLKKSWFLYENDQS